ncbi:MAG: peptide/nickel transport system ATP-binding protein [Solirubrobacteraceae bacterium]|nr:peptide/nickel transport system ATP-binding protein [Solirubrobacteraceae bacterium]
MSPLLEIDDLRVEFSTEDGVVHAVDGVSLAVAEGKTLGVVGESGSGKSVTGLTIMGLSRGRNATITGTAKFDGTDLVAMGDRDLRRIRGNEIAMIFQDPLSSLHPYFTIGRQLTEAYDTHHPSAGRGESRDRAAEMLDLVGIPDAKGRLDAYPHEFSGGMRQRTMIAMALINGPRLLIADEPTTALDVTIQAQILELIQRLQAELGMAVIMITHDLGVVAELADDVAVMYAGRIVERGPKQQIFEAPEHPYTWGLLGSIPRMTAPRDEELVPIPGRPPSLIHRPAGCHFHPRCPYVQPMHKETDPRLKPVGGDPAHTVACLLGPEDRRRLWAQLRDGALPEQARASILEPEAGS